MSSGVGRGCSTSIPTENKRGPGNQTQSWCLEQPLQSNRRLKIPLDGWIP